MFRIAIASACLAGAATGEPGRMDASAVCEAARDFGFDGIEWADGPFLRRGDRAAAEALMFATLRSRITVAGYAPDLLAGAGLPDSGDLDDAIATALGLNAAIVRMAIEPGARSEGRDRIALLDILRRIADRAGSVGITIALSPKDGSPLGTWSECIQVCGEADHPFLRLSWEPLAGATLAEGLAALQDEPSAFATLIPRGRGAPLEASSALWISVVGAFSSRPGVEGVGGFAVLDAGGLFDEASRAALEADLIFLRGAAIAADIGTG